jgi:hypothetical protein
MIVAGTELGKGAGAEAEASGGAVLPGVDLSTLAVWRVGG